MELAIDTSTETASIALSSQGNMVAELTWQAGQNHTAEILPNLNHVLQMASIQLEDLDGLIVATGPGSFNGLRVAMSVAKGLAFALNIPLVGISTLEAVAFPYAATALPVCPIQNAGRNEIATALFRTEHGEWRCLIKEHITTSDALFDEIEGQTIFCGKIPNEVKLQLRERLGEQALIMEGAANLRRAGYLAELGWRRLKEGDFDHSPTLQPLYLRKPSITISQKQRPPRDENIDKPKLAPL
ncbi:MAG: tRNA (adenosine(37)-N6)-threonylcarbamoyltransferase complex dimerization subunit type 1 TsaB [Chloroflexota bacterium]|nr:tRNA (adenosine(37)-N6)-threonylcarbamoyltransferase complex dimerization subunit type 1 TsaB [Chloroflexota bacterium]